MSSVCRFAFHRRSRLMPPGMSRKWLSAKIPDKEERPVASPARSAASFANSTAQGVGQVIFLNSAISGGVILVGLAAANPYLAGMASLGTVTATATAKAVGLETDGGLMGYNGCLVGCAAAVFGPASVAACTTSTVVGAAATPFVALALKEAIGNVPQWTFAFNIVALTQLLRTRPFLQAASDEPATSLSVNNIDILMAPVVGISQIFVVESALTGASILVGTSLYSPGLAGHVLLGSIIGTLVGVTLGAPVDELTMGLWGFNSALTSMAVGVFFVHSTPAIVLSAGGAAVTAASFGAMKTIFGTYGAPCLTLPFCVTMSGCYLIQKNLKGLVLASSPHSPEKNKAI